ncbi:MAG TPA: lysophospholipid acyltransferase family protein [Candidatus Limnocylindrales bacterium]|nr:lysophospholipid acyltransferase family protein [Candidatus Limnocylindrales bacterium]
MSARADAAPRSDPLGGLHPVRRTIRYYVARIVVAFLTRTWLRFDVEGRDRLPAGSAIYAFNHLSWVDPFALMATLPLRPRLSFFGPKEEDMRSSGRNRVMLWTGSAIPYKPGKNDLLEATRRVSAVIGKGGVLAIAAEGRIGAMEDQLLPLNEGAAFFALRSHVPLVPIAINGTTWLRFGTRVRVRIGEPIVVEGRPDRATVEALTSRLAARLGAMLADAPSPERTGRVAAWMTDRFNEWPEGSREAALAAQSARLAERSVGRAEAV